jgi:branched-chain amino acid transport system substrate-binding protein
MKRHRWRWLIAVACAAVPLAFLAANTGAAPKPIIIGVPVGLTGPLQPWGLWPMQMAQLAVDDVNKAGGVLGRPLKLVSCDDKSDFAANGAACATQVLDKGAVAILTSCDYDWSSPANSTAQKRKIPGISFCAGAPQFGPHGLGPYTFSMGIATPNEADVPAEWAYQVQKWRRVYLFNDTTIAYDTTYCKAFKKRWQQLGGTIGGEDAFRNGDASVAGQVGRMRGALAKFDFIVLCSYPAGGASAIRQIRSGGITKPIFMNVGMGGDYWFNTVPGLTNAYQGTYASWKGDDPRPKVNELSKRYAARYHVPDPRFPHAFMGYEAIQMLVAAMKQAGSTDGTKVANALRHMDLKNALIGEHRIDPTYDQSFTLPVTIMKITNGKVHFLTVRRPQINPKTLLPL